MVFTSSRLFVRFKRLAGPLRNSYAGPAPRMSRKQVAVGGYRVSFLPVYLKERWRFEFGMVELKFFFGQGRKAVDDHTDVVVADLTQVILERNIFKQELPG